eukprot:scaffold40797_cov63-Attheya_sp.AAC.10
MAIRDKGIILLPDANMGLEHWVDADFCGNWDREYAVEDSTMLAQDLATLSTTVDVPLLGDLSSKLKVLCLRPRPSMLHCHIPYVK